MKSETFQSILQRVKNVGKIQWVVLEIRSEAMNNECELVFTDFSTKAVLILKVICVK